MFEYFYHEILRKTIISFGNLFNDISIKKKNDNNDVFSVIKVPLAYGPTQKFLARLEQQPELNKPIQITLPRMSFEFVGLTYDPTRKVTTTQTFLSKSVTDSTDVRKTYMPVPYNMEFELSIMCKINDDMLQIIEQIVPYFQPSYNLTVNLIESIGEKRDIPVVLDNISMQDDYEGNFTTRRALIYTLRFTAKTYLFGPVSSSVSTDIIKKVSLGFVSGDSQSTARDLTYSQEPVASKSYTNNVVTTLTADVLVADGTISVQNSSSISVNSHITLDNETLKVTNKNGNILTVERGSYSTNISDHVSGTQVMLITSADTDLIELGDDFGFSGISFE
jgi:hypothetical protein